MKINITVEDIKKRYGEHIYIEGFFEWLEEKYLKVYPEKNNKEDLFKALKIYHENMFQNS